MADGSWPLADPAPMHQEPHLQRDEISSHFIAERAAKSA